MVQRVAFWKRFNRLKKSIRSTKRTNGSSICWTRMLFAVILLNHPIMVEASGSTTSMSVFPTLMMTIMATFVVCLAGLEKNDRKEALSFFTKLKHPPPNGMTEEDIFQIWKDSIKNEVPQRTPYNPDGKSVAYIEKEMKKAGFKVRTAKYKNDKTLVLISISGNGAGGDKVFKDPKTYKEHTRGNNFLCRIGEDGKVSEVVSRIIGFPKSGTKAEEFLPADAKGKKVDLANACFVISSEKTDGEQVNWTCFVKDEKRYLMVSSKSVCIYAEVNAKAWKKIMSNYSNWRAVQEAMTELQKFAENHKERFNQMFTDLSEGKLTASGELFRTNKVIFHEMSSWDRPNIVLWGITSSVDGYWHPLVTNFGKKWGLDFAERHCFDLRTPEGKKEFTNYKLEVADADLKNRAEIEGVIDTYFFPDGNIAHVKDKFLWFKVLRCIRESMDSGVSPEQVWKKLHKIEGLGYALKSNDELHNYLNVIVHASVHVFKTDEKVLPMTRAELVFGGGFMTLRRKVDELLKAGYVPPEVGLGAGPAEEEHKEEEEKAKKTLLVLQGPISSGKSTRLREMMKEHQGKKVVFLDADSIKEAGVRGDEQLRKFLQEQFLTYDVIVLATVRGGTKESRKKLTWIWKESKYDVLIYRMPLPPHETEIQMRDVVAMLRLRYKRRVRTGTGAVLKGTDSEISAMIENTMKWDASLPAGFRTLSLDELKIFMQSIPEENIKLPPPLEEWTTPLTFKVLTPEDVDVSEHKNYRMDSMLIQTEEFTSALCGLREKFGLLGVEEFRFFPEFRFPEYHITVCLDDFTGCSLSQEFTIKELRLGENHVIAFGETVLATAEGEQKLDIHLTLALRDDAKAMDAKDLHDPANYKQTIKLEKPLTVGSQGLFSLKPWPKKQKAKRKAKHAAAAE